LGLLLEVALDNPFQEGSRSSRLFEVLASADHPVAARELAAAVGADDPIVAHSMLKDLRGRGVTVYRYRDPAGGPRAESVYSLRPVEGWTEAKSSPGRPRSVPRSTPPAAMRPAVRQPMVGSAVRITGVFLDDEALVTRLECDGVVYRGLATKVQPTVGEWMTLVTVGLHGQGLYVDLAGARQVTLEDIVEESHGR
jgi:hypothetical protein